MLRPIWTIITTSLMVMIISSPMKIQGQDYVFSGPANTQFLPPPPNYRRNEYLNPQEISPFRQSAPGFQQIDSYLPQRDLQTSDLPYHLQQTLPQYRITEKTPLQFEIPPQLHQFNYQNSIPAPFKQQQQIIPSTHRPNYSHLFSHAHNRDPSQPETFLGEITLQNPVEPPPPQQFADFQPSTFTTRPATEIQTQNGAESHQNFDFSTTNKPRKISDNTVQLGTGTRANFLNHRTRILAPVDSNSKRVTKPLVKNYFINNNGEVFITTKIPFSPKPTTTIRTPTTVEKKNSFSPTPKPTGKPLSFNIKSNKKPFVPKNPSPTRDSFDLEPLLEEPIKNSSSNDDVVEVIKSLSAEVTNSSSIEDEDKYEETTEDYDYDVSTDNTLNSSVEYEDSEEDGDKNKYDDNNNIQDEEYSEDEDEEGGIEEETKKNFPYDIITTKPVSKTDKDNFKEFVDTTVIDTITEEPQTTFSNEEITTTDIPIVVTMSLAVNSKQEGNKTENDHGTVVSVVTTKSVVNNTFVATATPMPPVTENMMERSTEEPNTNEENSTDTWVVVASVQTSRSVSGARYLPKSIVAHEERVKLLNEETLEDDETTTEIEFTTTPSPSTTTKLKTSTESLIDKLDRVQSDLSVGLLTDGFKSDVHIAVITEPSSIGDKNMDITTMVDAELTSTDSSISTSSKSPIPAVIIKKFSALSRPSSTKRPRPKITFTTTTTTTTTTTEASLGDKMQGDEPPKNNQTKSIAGISNQTKIVVQDVSAFLPPGFTNDNQTKDDSSKLLQEILGKIKLTTKTEDVTDASQEPKSVSKILEIAKKDDVSAFLPPGFKPNGDGHSGSNAESKTTDLLKNAKVDDISAFLPPGYRGFKPKSTRTTTTSTTEKPENSVQAKPVEDLSGLLPSGFKTTTKKPKLHSLLEQAKPVDISAFLPPGYNKGGSTQKPTTINIEQDEVPTSLLPPGFRKFGNKPKVVGTTSTTTESMSTSSTTTSTTAKPSGFKVVFPSRPGGGSRKSATRLTTPRYSDVEEFKITAPSIRKGLPSRATTEFTGWPTPSTTPISIEKLLEAARAAAASTTSPDDDDELSSITSSTTTTTTTTTTTKPTTPGICLGECDLAGTIKLIDGVKWEPELLDRNTKEWQILANEVQSQLERVYSKSNILNKWYKEIRIDGFSEGSVLVDYLVELNDLGRQIDTAEIKKLFHDSLDDALTNAAVTNREGKSLNETTKLEGKLSLGDYIVDPNYTDFIVLPKQAYPTVGYAEDNVLLPQWAIAVIVIGLASLLFVIIFGVTVLVNRQKNAKKKVPVPLTEDMLNELNKNHMGGIDNYGADDLYNMEDVWDDRGYDPNRLPKKSSSGSIHDNSMSNLYDSWRSEWNGYYYNAYYGNQPGSSHGGYGGRRKSDYDTNF